ncbi:MAG: cell division protein SepF [Candidatus Aenigmarchaeota archaeon]|nr:cell division protein SepF [Candidatus Aenigmarchaeota archaeon]
MGIRDFFGKMGMGKEEAREEFLEVGDVPAEGREVNVKIESLKDYSDTDRVLQLLREGYVIFLKIRELREKDMATLKKAVEKLKKTISAMNGDVVGVDEDFLIIAPKFASIYRGKSATPGMK